MKNKKLISLLLGTVFLSVLAFTPHPAEAKKPRCEKYECPGGAPPAWAAHMSAVIASLVALENEIYLLLVDVIDAVTRDSNQHTKNMQNEINAEATESDKISANEASIQLADTRINASRAIMPARTACGVESQQPKLWNASTTSRAGVATVEGQRTDLFSNAPSTPSSKGELAYLSERFQNRMTKYCNSATVQPPSGLTCSASIGVDRDLSAYESIFKKGSFASADDYQAAQDVVQNILGNIVTDPVRGNALTRQDGKNLAILRNSDQSKANLASSVLQAIVERRHDTAYSGKSELSQQATASYTDSALKQLAVAAAEQNQTQNLDQISSMIGNSSRQLFVFRNYMEQWAALRAVSLAMDVKASSAGASR